MAVSLGYSGLLNSAFPRIGQYEASTGRRINKQVVQGLLQADLDKAKQFAMAEDTRNRQMGLEQQRIDIMKQQQTDAQFANKMAGYGQLAQLPIAYGAAKQAGFIPKGFDITSPSTWGGSSAPPAVAGGTSTAPLLANTAQGAIGAAGTTAGAQVPLMMQAAQNAAPVAPSLTAGLSGIEYGGGLGASSAAGEGLLGMLGAVALPAGIGALGMGLLSKPVAKMLGTHEKTTKDVMSIGGGAAVGFAVGGPIGGIIGGALGALGSIF